MVMANTGRFGRYIEKKENPGLALEIKRENETILVNSCKFGSSDFVTACHFGFSVRDGKRFLDGWCTYLGHKFSESLHISDAIWEQLKEGEVATLSYSPLETGGETKLVPYLNDKLIDSLGSHSNLSKK